MQYEHEVSMGASSGGGVYDHEPEGEHEAFMEASDSLARTMLMQDDEALMDEQRNGVRMHEDGNGNFGNEHENEHDHATSSTPLLLLHDAALAVAEEDERWMKKLQLSLAERKAVLWDQRAPAMDIVREEARYLAAIAWPIVLVSMLEMLPDTLLTMMIGRLDPARSTQLLAAFTLASLFRMLLMAGLFVGLASALDTLCAQAFGGKRLRELWIFAQSGLVMYAMLLPLLTVVLLNSSSILIALGQNAEISSIAAQLLLVTILDMPFMASSMILRSALQAQNIVVPLVWSSAIAWTISLPVAYLLGHFTPLGYMGIALSAALSDAIKVGILVVYVLRCDAFLNAWPGWRFREALHSMISVARLGVSSVLMMTFQLLGFSVMSLLAGMLKNAAVMISANSIFNSTLMLSFVPLTGVCVAGAVRIGNALGAGKARRASILGTVVVLSCVIVSIVAMIATALVSTAFAKLFTTNAEALAIVAQMTKALLWLIPLLGFLFGLQSILRASGKQWLCAKFNFAFLIVAGVSSGMVLGVRFGLGIIGLWYGQGIGMGLFLVAGIIWLGRAQWDDMTEQARSNTSSKLQEVEPSALMC